MPRPPRPARVVLTEPELAILNGKWSGAGGFQTLAPKLQAKVQPDGTLELSDEEVGEIVRYMSYDRSGFRDRVRKVFARSLTILMTQSRP